MTGRSATLPCQDCRYDLAGLDNAATCPECGGTLNWELIRSASPPISRKRAAAFILGPHLFMGAILAALLALLLLFDGQPSILVYLLALAAPAYLLAAPILASFAVHRLRATRDTISSWLEASVLGLLITATLWFGIAVSVGLVLVVIPS